jgi:oligopeptide transport system ATP-binding protein
MPSIRRKTEAMALLDVEGLSVRFRTEAGELAAVDQVSFALEPGRVMGIVGESGSGKTQILMALMGLLAENGRAEGRARLNGAEILNLPPVALDRIRGQAMSIVFQDPMTALNPYMRIGAQLVETLVAHRGMTSAQAKTRAIEMLALAQIPEPEQRFSRYPHELSGGMRQRVMIAMALLCEPALLLADEPTTALDVTVQSQILDLIAGLAARLGTAVILVTHDLGVVARLCDEVMVLYGGRVMEQAKATDLFARPLHPYTRGLLAAIPRLDRPVDRAMSAIPGQPPSPLSLGPGCPFEPRCADRIERCAKERPGLERQAGRAVACHRSAS